MFNKKLSYLLLLTYFCSSCLFSQPIVNPFGQNIQIRTQLHSFLGRPSWLLILRDVKTGQVYPYIYDIERGDNFWLAFSYSRNYLVTVSRMQFSTYDIKCNSFKKYRINNFCNLESNGRIIRGKSMAVTITGDLSPFHENFACHITAFPDGNFTIANP